MLTKKELNLVKHFAREISDYGWFPFDWKYDKSQPTTSKFKKLIVWINFICSVLYFIFISLRLSPKFGGGITLTSMPFHGFTWIIHIVYIVFYIHMFIYPAEVSYLLNQLINFNTFFGKSQLNKIYLDPNIREKVIGFLRRWINGAACTILAIFIFQPNNVYFIYSILPSCYKNIFTHLLFLPIEAYVVVYKIMIFHLFVILLGFFYIVTTNFWVEKVCIEWTTGSEFVNNLSTNLKIYRSLFLLNILYNTSFASLIVPGFKTLIEMAVVICTYGCIRLYGKIPFYVYIMLPGLASFLFVEHQFAVDRMANVHETSSKIQSKYGSNYSKLPTIGDVTKQVKYIHRYLKSCRPMRCHLTHALFVEKSTRLVLLNMLLNSVVTLLLGDKGNNN